MGEGFSTTTTEGAAAIYHSVLTELLGDFRPADVPDFGGGQGFPASRGYVRSITVPGYLSGPPQRRAVLRILLGEKDFSEPDYIRRFNWTTSGPIRAPRVRLRGEVGVGYPWYIFDDIGGAPLISETLYAGDPRSGMKTKRAVADIFWSLTAAYLTTNGLPKNGPAPSIWFDDRAVQWTRIGEENGSLKRRLLSPATFVSSIETLRAASENIPAPGSFFSQAHFCNATIRTTQEKIFLTDWQGAKFVPLMYDAALWVWHAALHSWNVGTRNWLLEVEDYEDAFCRHGMSVAGRHYDEKTLRHAFRACLLERMLAAILVDYEMRFPPGKPIREQQRVLQNARATLKLLLQVLR